MQRRRFLQILSFLSSAYASAKGRLILARDKAALSRKLAYEQIRENLSGTRIYIVPYAHSDWAWVHTRQWQADRDNLIFNEVLDILRHHPEYRWFLDTQNEEL